MEIITLQLTIVALDIQGAQETGGHRISTTRKVRGTLPRGGHAEDMLGTFKNLPSLHFQGC